MRKAGVSALLIVCLFAFLCIAVGKPNVISEAKPPACCSKAHTCKMADEQTSRSHKGCAGDQSQPRGCCTVSCSTLILFCPTSNAFSIPRFTGYGFSTGDQTASARVEPPPIPPPRV
jgi:hypothetical protein